MQENIMITIDMFQWKMHSCEGNKILKNKHRLIQKKTPIDAPIQLNNNRFSFCTTQNDSIVDTVAVWIIHTSRSSVTIVDDKFTSVLWHESRFPVLSLSITIICFPSLESSALLSGEINGSFHSLLFFEFSTLTVSNVLSNNLSILHVSSWKGLNIDSQ